MGQYQFDPSVNLISLDVQIEGKPSTRPAYLRMGVDTGASFTIIPWHVVESLGYDPAHHSDRIRFMTGSGMDMAPLLTVQAIEVLGVRQRHVPVLCHDLPQRSLVDGLLGLSFLRHCRLAINFPRGVLELRKGSPIRGDKWE